jgi:Bacterial Ig-like domain/Cadherin domain/RTX calcium-binding nonapeptide repeat (4 copies)
MNNTEVSNVQSSPVQSSPVQSSPVQSSPVQSSPVQSSKAFRDAVMQRDIPVFKSKHLVRGKRTPVPLEEEALNQVGSAHAQVESLVDTVTVYAQASTDTASQAPIDAASPATPATATTAVNTAAVSVSSSAVTSLALGSLAVLGVAAAGGGGSTPAKTPDQVSTTDSTAPVFTSAASASVAENTAISAVVYVAKATDNTAVVAYKLAADMADNNVFTLDEKTGELRFKTSPDFESKTSYSVQVQALDAAGNVTTQTVTINVTDVIETVQAQLIDSPVAGVEVWANGQYVGTTDANGFFNYKPGQQVSFKIGNLELAANLAVPSDQKVYLHDLAGLARTESATNPAIVKLAQLLQTLDADNNPDNGISINKNLLRDDLAPTQLASSTTVASLLDAGTTVVTPAQALQHYNNSADFLSARDKTAPTAIITLSDTHLTLGEAATVTIKFSEKVNLFNAAGEFAIESLLAAGNATVSGFSSTDGGMTYVGTLTPKVGVTANASASNSLKLDLRNVSDESGNRGGIVESPAYTVDTPLVSAATVFAEAAAQGGYYQTMFDLAKASYIHPASLQTYPGMADGKATVPVKGISFSVNAADLGLKAPSTVIPNEGSVFADGYFVAFDQDYLDRSSVALVGRSQDALFLTFRGTNSAGDAWDDAVDMSGHYTRYAPLFAGIDNYLKTHLEIKTVYVGGHSLGGQMASMYMQRHQLGTSAIIRHDDDGSAIAYKSVTFEAANKGLEGNNVLLDASKMNDPRAIGFEMPGDPVPDLSLSQDRVDAGSNNYGNTVYLEYEAEDSFLPHGMSAVEGQLNQLARVAAALSSQAALKNVRYYVDDNNDGLVVTTGQATVVEGLNNAGVFSGALTADLILQSSNPVIQTISELIAGLAEQNHIDSSFPFTAAVNRIYQENLAEYKSTGLYNFESVWSNNPSQLHTLVVRPFGLSEGETYVMPEKGIDGVLAKDENWFVNNDFDIDARPSDHKVLLIGNGGQNRLTGSRYDDVLIGSDAEDLLAGGAGNDTLYGGRYADVSNLPYWAVSQANRASQYINVGTGDNVSYMRGGSGNDLVIASGNNDYIFVDVTWGSTASNGNNANNVDTISQFDPGANGDYLIFSAQQLGISYASLGAWGWDFETTGLKSQWGSQSVARQAPNLGWQDDDEEHFFKVSSIANYAATNTYLQDVDSEGFNDYLDSLPAWILAEDTGYLYFDADGNKDYDDEFLVAKLNPSAVAGFDADNILLMDTFGMFTLNPEDVPPFTVNYAPTGSVSFTAGNNLIQGVAHTASHTLQDANGLSDAVSYQWQVSSDGVSKWLSIGSGSSFALSAANISQYVGYRLRVVASYTDNDGFTETVSSAVSSAIIVNADVTVPTATITDNVAGTASGDVVFTFQFSEAVKNFTSNDVKLSGGGTKGAFTAVDADTYTLTVTGLTGSGTLSVDIDHLNGITTDLAGNPLGDVAAVTQAYSIGSAGNYTLGQAVIDLGDYGKLMAPVHVDGKWYYVWDMNGDGVHNDALTHNLLDGIFKFASDFSTTKQWTDSDNVFRFGRLNGVQLALPTIGNGDDYVSQTELYNRGSYAIYHGNTAIDTSPAGTVNSTYDDLLAVWDAHNGSSLVSSGVPAGWFSGAYWSATPSARGHAILSLNAPNGSVFDNSDYAGDGKDYNYRDYYYYAAIEVLAPNADTTAPTLSITGAGSTVTTSSTTFTFQFNEAVTGFDVSDILLTGGGTKGTFSAVDADTYTLQVTGLSGNGTLGLDVNHLTGGVTDAAQNALGDVAVVTQAYAVPNAYTLGQAVIDLGEFGKLMQPMNVDGKWYYVWDMNGDGEQSEATNNAGKLSWDGSTLSASGTGYKFDFMTHDVLDGIFKFDSAGNLETSANAVGSVGDTDNVFRFANLNGVNLALPTIGNGSSMITTSFNATGTVIDNSPAGEMNPTYDDLLAVWDGYNGSGTETSSQAPSGNRGDYGHWSATPATSGHAWLYVGYGYVDSTYRDTNTNYATVQVL